MFNQSWRSIIALTLVLLQISNVDAFFRGKNLRASARELWSISSGHVIPELATHKLAKRTCEELHEKDEGDDSPDDQTLAPCMTRCAPNRYRKDGSRVKRSACGGFDDALGICPFDANITESSQLVHNRKRALDDIRKQSQTELGKWMDDRIAKGDVKMLFDFDDDKQFIELIGEDERIRKYGIPTSFFEIPSTEPFAWGAAGLVGCTMMVIIKTPTKEDPSSGVYMGHYWEVPAWTTDDDWELDDKNEPIMTDKDGNALPKKRVMTAQFTHWVSNFLKFGFPHDKINHRPEKDKQTVEPTPQISLEKVKDRLWEGQAIIIHPRKTTKKQNGDYSVNDGPQYAGNLRKMADLVQKMFDKQIKFLPNFLYVPDRLHDRPDAPQPGPGKGKVVFEFDPNWQNTGKKMGMLLIEDGGLKDGDKPGPGGPFYYDFDIPDPE